MRSKKTGRFLKGNIPFYKGKKGSTNSGSFKKGHIGYNKNSGFGLSFYEREHRWFIICRNKKKIPFARALIEGYLGIKLKKQEVVHHINKNETDDRLINLQVLTRSEHINIHRKDLRK